MFLVQNPPSGPSASLDTYVNEMTNVVRNKPNVEGNLKILDRM